ADDLETQEPGGHETEIEAGASPRRIGLGWREREAASRAQAVDRDRLAAAANALGVDVAVGPVAAVVPHDHAGSGAVIRHHRRIARTGKPAHRSAIGGAPPGPPPPPGHAR